MNVFDLDRALVSDYERFARSFTQIRAPDIHRQVEVHYASDRFWPEPLISINPRFERGASVDQLVEAGSLHEATGRVFSADGSPLTLYRHQAQAVAKATTGKSFVVTTGVILSCAYSAEDKKCQEVGNDQAPAGQKARATNGTELSSGTRRH